MGRIQGKNTKPEIFVRSFLHKNGYRFRLHKTGLPGKPDIVLAKYKTVIFVHGCYWHRHSGCKRGQSMPSMNVKFWRDKFQKNVSRDKETKKKLEKAGWKVIVVWECDLSDSKRLLSTLKNKISGS